MGTEIIWTGWNNNTRLKLITDKCTRHDNVVDMGPPTTTLISIINRLVKAKLSSHHVLLVKQPLDLPAKGIESAELAPMHGTS